MGPLDQRDVADLTVPVGEAVLVCLVPEEEVEFCRSLLQAASPSSSRPLIRKTESTPGKLDALR